MIPWKTDIDYVYIHKFTGKLYVVRVSFDYKYADRVYSWGQDRQIDVIYKFNQKGMKSSVKKYYGKLERLSKL